MGRRRGRLPCWSRLDATRPTTCQRVDSELSYTYALLDLGLSYVSETNF